jgi:poly(3-hydroxybutyrate) depolymerase
LGIDFRPRSGGLDDLRRYVRVLTEVLEAMGPRATLRDLREGVERFVADWPFCEAAALRCALASAAALDGDREVEELCEAMRQRRPRRLGRGARERRTFHCPGTGRAIEVETYMPDVRDRSSVPILLLLHGFMRDPARHLAPWLPLAAAHGFAVVAPCFSREDFPGSRDYNQGGLLAPDGALQPRERWLFHSLERLFDAARAWVGSSVPRYCLYGHSAGAQVVHRMVLTFPEARFCRAVAANAGWYTLPTFEIAFPYGVAGLPLDDEQLERALGAPLTVLLGEEDDDPQDPLLRRSPAALAQGAHRLARGIHFHRLALRAAADRGVPCGWTRRQVPGVGHDHEAMAAAASKILLENHR